MLIEAPRLERENGRTRVVAKIAGRDPRLAAVPELWFETADDPGAITERADPFAAALLPIASTLGEDLDVRGPLSPQLAIGLRELSRVHTAWWPRGFRPVEVRSDSFAAPPPAAGVAAVFSGGVDSFFTLWRHLPQNEPLTHARLTHAVMINGFDLDVEDGDGGRFAALRAVYQPLFDRFGIRFVVVRTNLQQFRHAVMPDRVRFYAFGTVLQAAGLALSGHVGTCYLPAAGLYSASGPDGVSPTTDPLADTEGLRFVHDGADAARPRKTETIASWPETWTRLRVCSNPGHVNVDAASSAVRNCGLCPKCARTMLTLDLLGALQPYTTFPAGERIPYARPDYGSPSWGSFAAENVRLALGRRRYAVAVCLAAGLTLFWIHRSAWLLWSTLRALRASVVH